MSMKELQSCFAARDTGVWIKTVEEMRVCRAAAALGAKYNVPVRLWSCAVGFTELSGAQDSEMNNTQDPSEALPNAMQRGGQCIYVMRDFHHYVDPNLPQNVPIIRAIRDITRASKEGSADRYKMFIFVSPTVELPADLQESIVLIKWELPGDKELGAVLDSAVKARGDLNITLNTAARDAVISAAKGLTIEEFANVLGRSMASTGKIDVELIHAGKRQAVERNGKVQWIDPEITMDDVGGLEILKQWALNRQACFTREAREFGIKPPRGALLYGVPGCGKSWSAKALAAAWGVPLLRLDIATLKGGLVGESENNLQAALDTAAAVGQVVVMIDEIEKAVAGSDSGLDSGVGANMLGLLLTFMQENKSPVFIVATCNNMESLPPELRRKGRFSEIFFVDLPHAAERKEVWRVHIKRAKRDPAAFPLQKLAEVTDGFSPAEIEACVEDALIAAFSVNEELTEKHLLAAVKECVPLSKVAAEKIKAIRDFARGRCRPASKPPEVTPLEEASDEMQANRFAVFNPSGGEN